MNTRHSCQSLVRRWRWQSPSHPPADNSQHWSSVLDSRRLSPPVSRGHWYRAAASAPDIRHFVTIVSSLLFIRHSDITVICCHDTIADGRPVSLTPAFQILTHLFLWLALFYWFTTVIIHNSLNLLLQVWNFPFSQTLSTFSNVASFFIFMTDSMYCYCYFWAYPISALSFFSFTFLFFWLCAVYYASLCRLLSAR